MKINPNEFNTHHVAFVVNLIKPEAPTFDIDKLLSTEDDK